MSDSLPKRLARDSFKGQNIAQNAYITNTGGEMDFSQAMQAWAAGVTPRVEMNPILLKPQGNMTNQVIIKGKVVGTTKRQTTLKITSCGLADH